MASMNVPLLSYNRGLISPKALARVDLDRTRLSAEVMTNWLPKSQGAMRLRPGTKWLGSSYSDTGAEWIEFVAATDDTALVELTDERMRIWIDDALLGRPAVATTLTLSDTGWSNTSTGGTFTTGSTTDVIPAMTGATTNGVTIAANHENTSDSINGGARQAWKAADNNSASWWQDTGSNEPTTVFPTTWQVDFGASNTQAITSYSLQARNGGSGQMPSVWEFQRSDDGAAWTTEDTQGSELTWANSETRTYSLPGGDTGTVEARRHWRFSISAVAATRLDVAEIQMFTAASSSQVSLQGGQLVLNAKADGSFARREKRVIVDTGDYNVEHSLDIVVDRGPVILRVGSTQRDDDYIGEANLGTGYHNLAFTPSGDFWVTLQSRAIVDRVVSSLTIGDTGTVEVSTFYDTDDLPNLRYDQSADVIYMDADGAHPCKIERRGTGRSWSFVKFLPNNGPFLPAASSSAKLSVSKTYGNTTMNSDVPYFTSEQVGSLIKLFHQGQSGVFPLGALGATTEPVKVTGIADTGTATAANERRVVFAVTGTWAGAILIERSFDGPDIGFHPASVDYMAGSAFSDTGGDTGTFTRTIDDEDSNVDVWYRARVTRWTSGAAVVALTYKSGGTSGIARITGYNSNTDVAVEVLSRFSDTGATDNWQAGAWSDRYGYPSSVALHEGRLGHAGGASIYLSVSDDYENFDIDTIGDAGPIIKTLGSGPVDRCHYLLSLLRLIIGTAGAEIAVRSSSLDEPLTPTNSMAKPFSTQGSANLRPAKMDTRAVFVQRSTQRVFMIGFGQSAEALGDYEARELTQLVPDLLEAGVVSLAIQRQPDTRIHCVLTDGRVAILTFEPQEEVICWSMWETDGVVEKAMVLPGTNEDKVYYHVNRTINGATKRYLERWAMESEANGDTGLSFIADCAISYTDTGRATTIQGADHLIGESVVVWGDDTGQSYPSKDYSPDVAGVQTTYTVDTGGNVNLTGADSVHHAVVGLPYTANYKTTKLAYAAEHGTALAQMKRADKIGFVLIDAHNNGLFFGNDTGHLDPLPRVLDNGAAVDSRKIFGSFDNAAMVFPGLWNADSRICLKAKAPRPMTVAAAVPTISTNEKV